MQSKVRLLGVGLWSSGSSEVMWLGENLTKFCAVLSEMIEVVKNFESVRKQWLHAEIELKKYKELLVKSDVAKAALEVKLKHARNQLDVEMKKRYKIEGDYQYLVRKCHPCLSSDSRKY